MNFANKQENFQTNFAVHSVNTKKRNHFNCPISTPSFFKKSAYYAGIKIFNSLLSSLTSFTNKEAQFKVALKYT
jgi:hypothetical protein